MDALSAVVPQALPDPPEFGRDRQTLPPFYRMGHAYTKWMLNMIRMQQDYRLTTMAKEKPLLFQQFYQLPDLPERITGNATDTTPCFNKRAVMYLSPLCMAIYLKKTKAVKCILNAGVNHPLHRSFAADVFKSGKAVSEDLIDVLPICVALRRQAFNIIPLLCEAVSITRDTADASPTVLGKFALRYVTREIRKIYRYKDAVQYAVELLKVRPSYAFASFLEAIADSSPDELRYCLPDHECEGNKISVFRRLVRYSYCDDQECRLTYQLALAMDVLLRHKIVQHLDPAPDTSDSASKRAVSTDYKIRDQDATLYQLLCLYQRLYLRGKNNTVDYLAEVVYRYLDCTGWKKTFITQEVGHLTATLELRAERPGSVTRNVMEVLCKHIKVIDHIFEDRESREYYKSPFLNNSNNLEVLKTKFYEPVSKSVCQKDVQLLYNTPSIKRSTNNLLYDISRAPEQVFSYRHTLSRKELKLEEIPSSVTSTSQLDDCGNNNHASSVDENDDINSAVERALQSATSRSRIFQKSHFCETLKPDKHTNVRNIHPRRVIDKKVAANRLQHCNPGCETPGGTRSRGSSNPASDTCSFVITSDTCGDSEGSVYTKLGEYRYRRNGMESFDSLSQSRSKSVNSVRSKMR